MRETLKTFTTKDGKVATIIKGETRTKASPQEKKFAEHYSVCCEGAAAAIAAGYSVPTAKQMAQKLLKRQGVMNELEAIYAARREKNEITAERVIAELGKVGFSDISKETGVKDTAKVAALAHLAKVLGMMVDRTVHSGSITAETVPENVAPEQAKEAYLKIIK